MRLKWSTFHVWFVQRPLTQCRNVDVPTGSSHVQRYSDEIEFRFDGVFFCAKQLWHALAEGIL